MRPKHDAHAEHPAPHPPTHPHTGPAREAQRQPKALGVIFVAPLLLLASLPLVVFPMIGSDSKAPLETILCFAPLMAPLMFGFSLASIVRGNKYVAQVRADAGDPTIGHVRALNRARPLLGVCYAANVVSLLASIVLGGGFLLMLGRGLAFPMP